MGAVRRAVVGVTAAMLIVGAAGTPAQAASKAPGGLKSTEQSPTALTLDWGTVSKAPRYRVQLATSSSMKNATYHRFMPSEGRVSGLKPDTTYYAKVRVITASGGNVSPYSKAISVRTKAVPTPTGLQVQAPGSTEVRASWQPAEGAARYEAQVSTSSSMSSPVWSKVSTASTSVKSRKAETMQYVRVRAVSAAGKATGWSATKSVRTPAAGTAVASSDLRVASYNLSGSNNDGSASGDRRVWAERQPVVVGQVLAEKSDVVGLQEAYQGGSKPQYDQLRDALQAKGGSYEVVDRDKNTSRATRILYNDATLTVKDHGSVAYQDQVSGRTPRYLVWATFTQKSTGKSFFFANTHLAPEDQALKVRQWRELVSQVQRLNSANLPVVTVGDFNTSKFNSKYEAAPREMLPAMKSAGFGDVMNQEFKVNPPRGVRAEKVVNGWINSFNGFRRDVRAYSYPDRRDKVGNGIDWVFASNALRVKEWKVVIDLDPSTLQIRGVIPSDHLMISSVLTL